MIYKSIYTIISQGTTGPGHGRPKGGRRNESHIEEGTSDVLTSNVSITQF